MEPRKGTNKHETRSNPSVLFGVFSCYLVVTLPSPRPGSFRSSGEPASRAMIDTPGLYWWYGSDSWKQWELGDVYCESTAVQVSRDGHVVELPR